MPRMSRTPRENHLQTLNSKNPLQLVLETKYMLQPNHSVMCAIHLMKPRLTSQKPFPLTQMLLQPSPLVARNQRQRNRIENIHLLHTPTRLILPRHTLQPIRHSRPILQRLGRERDFSPASFVGDGDDVDDSIGAGKRHHFRREGGRAVFGDETKEISEGEETFCLVELAHAEFDMWRKVEGAEEADFVAVGLEHFADLEGEHTAVAVACYGVRAVRLLRFDGGVLGRDYFFDRGEVGLARVEAAGVKGVDGAVGKMFG